jgi:hypothetical protein
MPIASVIFAEQTQSSDQHGHRNSNSSVFTLEELFSSVLFYDLLSIKCQVQISYLDWSRFIFFHLNFFQSGPVQIQIFQVDLSPFTSSFQGHLSFNWSSCFARGPWEKNVFVI